MNEQFGRYANLTLERDTQGLDLSQLRFKFQTTNNDLETPNTAVIRVYNCKARDLKEFDTVTLDVGYENNHAVIFRGSIKQVRLGKETNVDSFVEIMAADNDIGYNFGFVNMTFAAGASPEQELKVYADAMGVTVDPDSEQYVATGGILPNPRGKVAFGLARSYMRDLAYTHNLRWTVENGVLFLIPVTSYVAGEAVKINSLTGMVGIPEATDNGINVRVLLNPRIKIGRAIQLNNKDITQTDIRNAFYPGYRTQTRVANLSNDGLYRVLVAEHVGDTRGNDWYTDIICLNIDISAPSQSAVAPA